MKRSLRYPNAKLEKVSLLERTTSLTASEEMWWEVTSTKLGSSRTTSSQGMERNSTEVPSRKVYFNGVTISKKKTSRNQKIMADTDITSQTLKPKQLSGLTSLSRWRMRCTFPKSNLKENLILSIPRRTRNLPNSNGSELAHRTNKCWWEATTTMLQKE